jgi:hypothetical protein
VLFFLPKVDRALLGSHTSYEYAHNKEGNQKVKNTFPENVEKSNPRGEAELNCEHSELLPCEGRQKTIWYVAFAPRLSHWQTPYATLGRMAQKSASSLLPWNRAANSKR